MIPPEKESQIRRLFHAERWTPGTIAKQLGIHHETVRRVLMNDGVPAAAFVRRASMSDPYVPFILETLERYPTLPGSRLYEMARERGYAGGPDHFRAIIARHRPRRKAEAFLRLRTLPGEQAQVDWAHFGHVDGLGGRRPLVAFVVVLSWSRRIFLRFAREQKLATFLACHEEAFRTFGGVPRVLLYDNLKSVVLERHGDAIRFQEDLLAFAGHYRYEPRPCAPYRGNEKGRVERAIRYVRDSFFPAREWRDVDDLNTQADAWCEGIASDRRLPDDRTLTVREAFAEERGRLLALPADGFPVAERVEVRVGKTPYVRFDHNDYSVPHDQVRRVLTVVATTAEVRVLDAQTEIARHARSWGAKQVVEDPAHIAALVAEKQEAAQARGVDRLLHAVPECRALIEAAAERGHVIGRLVRGLGEELDRYGSARVGAAVHEVLAADAPHLTAVRQVLDRQPGPPPLGVALPDDARVRDLRVEPHALGTYDRLGGGQ
jgi:transposase